MERVTNFLKDVAVEKRSYDNEDDATGSKKLKVSNLVDDITVSKTAELIQSLKNLQASQCVTHLEYLERLSLVEKFLKALFYVEVSGTELQKSERNVIGLLLVDQLSAIGSWVSYSTVSMLHTNLEHFKVLRSGLEFLLENYKELPDGKGHYLGDAFELFKATEDIEEFDLVLKDMDESYDPDVLFLVFRKSVLKNEELISVPDSHWWWLGEKLNRALTKDTARFPQEILP